MNAADRFDLASNIISVLTFIVALFTSILAFYTLTVEAETEVKQFEKELKSAEAQLTPLLQWKVQNVHADHPSARLDQIYQSTHQHMNDIVASIRDDLQFTEGPLLIRRLRWASQREKVIAKFQQLSNQRVAMILQHIEIDMR